MSNNNAPTISYTMYFHLLHQLSSCRLPNSSPTLSSPSTSSPSSSSSSCCSPASRGCLDLLLRVDDAADPLPRSPPVPKDTAGDEWVIFPFWPNNRSCCGFPIF